MSMQKIREWMEQNPDGANELRRQNKSYVFFREVQLSDKDEAVGAQGVPLTPGRSIAVDKALHVYGTPFFIEGELPIESERSKTPFRRLMIAQDTGSAIVGPARADLYFGAGAEAGKVAGRLRHNARFVMLVPKSLDPVARGRKMPVPDERPSEKIAKLFPQTDPLKDPPGNRRAVRSHRRSTAATNTKDCGSAGDTARSRPSQTSAIQAAAAKPVPLPEPRPDHRAGLGKAPPASPPPLSLRQMKRRTSSSIPELPVAAAAQAWTERRGARAVGKRRQAGQAAAQTTSRCEAAVPRSAGRRKPKLTPKPAASPRHARAAAHRCRRRSRSRRRWRRSAVASVRICRAAARRSMPGSICTA